MHEPTIAATDLYLDGSKSTAVLEGPDAAFLLKRAGGVIPREWEHLVGKDGLPLGDGASEPDPEPAPEAKPKPKPKVKRTPKKGRAPAKGRAKAPATKEVKPEGDK